jgi:hypothetical protein
MQYTIPTTTLDWNYVVGWWTLALINVGLAQSKNRRGWLWFILSALAGPIATFLIVVWDKAPSE